MTKTKQIENQIPKIISYFENNEYKELKRKAIKTLDNDFYVIYEEVK